MITFKDSELQDMALVLSLQIHQAQDRLRAVTDRSHRQILNDKIQRFTTLRRSNKGRTKGKAKNKA